MRLLLAANNQATRRNEIIKSYLQLGSSSNRYAPRLPQQETKSSTKQLPPTGPILGPENILKTGFAQKGLPSSGVSALLAWFPASWARKVAPCFIGDAGGAAQLPQEVTIQSSTREGAKTQRDDSVQAVKFTDKKVPGLHLDLDEDLQAAGCFTEAIRGYQMGWWNQMSCAIFSQQERPESRLT